VDAGGDWWVRRVDRLIVASFPLEVMPKRLLQLSFASQKAVEAATKAVADNHKALAIEKGSRHAITTNKKRYPLDKVTSKRTGSGSLVQYTNEPLRRALGAWVIVTNGSRPHTIAPKGLTGKVKRLNKSLNLGRKLTKAQARLAAQLVTGQGMFEGVKPLWINSIGPRFVVHHPGHKSLGTPWQDAEDASNRVAEALFDETVIDTAVRLMTR
jgi:hypothetical protein